MATESSHPLDVVGFIETDSVALAPLPAYLPSQHGLNRTGSSLYHWYLWRKKKPEVMWIKLRSKD